MHFHELSSKSGLRPSDARSRALQIIVSKTVVKDRHRCHSDCLRAVDNQNNPQFRFLHEFLVRTKSGRLYMRISNGQALSTRLASYVAYWESGLMDRRTALAHGINVAHP